MHQKLRLFLLVGALAFGAALDAVGQGNAAPSPSIVGVWRLAEVITEGPNEKRNTNPQPGVLIFTQHFYSANVVTSEAPRPELPATGATDEQRADAFGAFDAVTGGYEIMGSQIVFTRIASKNPNAMRPGSKAMNTFRLEGDTLW